MGHAKFTLPFKKYIKIKIHCCQCSNYLHCNINLKKKYNPPSPLLLICCSQFQDYQKQYSWYCCHLAVFLIFIVITWKHWHAGR